jgi:hypothetical protein
MATSNMWNRLRQILDRLFGSGSDEPDPPLRSPEARARFWDEMREGQREAVAAAKPKGT